MSRLDDCYNVFDLRDAAKRRLPRAVFEFVDRSTEDEVALRNNRAAFERIKLRHRSLVDVSNRQTKTTLFGKEIALPMRGSWSWPRRRRRRKSPSPWPPAP
jgi:(S)-mandelate dehydrogenase